MQNSQRTENNLTRNKVQNYMHKMHQEKTQKLKKRKSYNNIREIPNHL